MVPILAPAASSDNLHGARLSNRSKNTPLSGVSLIDTVKVSGPIRDFDIREQLLRRSISQDGEFTDVVVFADQDLRRGGRVTIYRTRTGELGASVEGSLPKMLHGHNLNPVSVRQARLLIAELHGEASRWVDWRGSAADLRVSRIDLDQDFTGVDDVDHLLSHLARLRVPRIGSPSFYHDAERGGAATLVREPRKAKTWRACLYDKGAEMAHLVTKERDPARRGTLSGHAVQAQGRLRFEVQLRTQPLRDSGVSTVADLDQQHLLSLREKYFRRVRFDTEVHGPSRLRALATRLADGDPNCKYLGQVWQMLLFEAEGLPYRCSPTTLARNRRLAEKWELSGLFTVEGVVQVAGRSARR
jgi:hypothetical protein